MGTFIYVTITSTQRDGMEWDGNKVSCAEMGKAPLRQHESSVRPNMSKHHCVYCFDALISHLDGNRLPTWEHEQEEG